MSSLALLLVIIATAIRSTSMSPISQQLPGNIYYLANSNLRTSSDLPNGSRWSSVLNQTAPAYPQLHFFCERLAMFDLISALHLNFPTNTGISKTKDALNVTMDSACHLWDCSVDPKAYCVWEDSHCPDIEAFLTKMRTYCPKILLASDKLWKQDLGSNYTRMS